MKKDIPVYSLQSFEEYKNKGIYIGRFGKYAETHRNLHTVHGHSFFHLVFFTEAKGKQTIDFQSADVHSGMIYFMIPGQVHSWQFEGKPEGYVINFSPDYFKSFLLNTAYLSEFSFFDGVFNKQIIDIPDLKMKQIEDIFESLLRETNNKQTHEDELIKMLILQLFIAVDRLSVDTATQKDKSIAHGAVKAFQLLIEKHFIDTRLPKEYAALLFLTPNHLNSICMKLIGKSAGQMIRERVILEAKRLLINLDLNISEISANLHFKDQSYFTKFFKKYETVTPENFRKQNTISWKA